MVPEIVKPHLQRMWTHGPLCRYVEDLETITKIIVGNEKAEHFGLNRNIDISKIRVFYMDQFKSIAAPNLSTEVRNTTRKVSKYFEKAFNITSHRVDFSIAHHAVELWGAAATGDEDIKAFDPKTELTFLAASSNSIATIAIGNNEEKKFVQSKLEQLKKEIQDLLQNNGILILPVVATQAPFHIHHDFMHFNNIYTMLFNALGFPAISCPLGLGTNGLPLGVQVAGPPNSDGLLIAVAKELEKGFGGWVPPGIIHDKNT